MSNHVIDPSFESFVRNAMEETVSGATPVPLPNSVRRRARARQAVTATVTTLGAAAVIVAALTFTGSIFSSDPTVDVGGRQMDARGAGGVSPCPDTPFGGGAFEHGTGDYNGIFCISQGSYEGVSWSLGTSWSRGAPEDRALCIATGTMGGGAAAGVGSSCGPLELREIGLHVSQIDGYPKMAVGQVPGDTETLFLEHGGDQSFELEVYRAPKAFPLDLGFYLVFMPDDAQTLVAYDANGDEITRRNIDGEPGTPGEETERTRTLPIDEGEFSGVSWALDTFGTVIDGRETVCTSLQITDEPEKGVTGRGEETCHIGVPNHDVIGIAKLTTEEVPGVVAYSGVMSSRVDSLVMRTNDGREFDAEIIAAPAGIEDSLAYFVFIVDGVDAEGLTATMVAKSAGGAILAEREV